MNTKIKKIICYLVAATLIIAVVFLAASKMKTKNKNTETEPQTAVSEELVTENTEETEKVEIYRAESTPQTAEIGEAIESPHAILIDEQAKTIIAQKNPYEKMYPASMTKVMTVLVACENISPEDLDKTVPVSREATDYSYVNGCSAAGFDENELVTVRDLLYGTILPSGGEAAYQLALYIAGSMESFVAMMNDKAQQLGLAQTTHFANSVGIFDEQNYTTAYDMAVIMETALSNEMSREVITTHVYKTSVTEQHPEGITLVNKFFRKIKDEKCGGTVLGAKTGFVNESGNCAVSYEQSASGRTYICVTAGAHGAMNCVENHEAIYSAYAK